MAITQEQADKSTLFHQEGLPQRTCDGARGPQRWRRNGKTQRWKRNPERFRIPVKYGLYDYAQITNEHQSSFHALEDCTVGVTGDYRNHAVGCLAAYEHPGSCLDAERTTVW